MAADQANRAGAQRLADALRLHPIIAAVRDQKGLEAALAAPVQVIFLLSSSILGVGEVGQRVRGAGKQLFIHLDFVEGLARDDAALEYLAAGAAPAGVITTRTGLVHAARKAGVLPVQRLFLLDSQSVQTGIDSARASRAEVVEVLPGIVPRAIRGVRSQLPHTLIIAGGLVRTPKEVGRALAAGAAGISTGSEALWQMSAEELINPEGGGGE